MAYRHFDIVGHEIFVDDCVAFVRKNTMFIGRVSKLNTKQLTISLVNTKGMKRIFHAYSEQTTKLNPDDVSMYIMRGCKSLPVEKTEKK